MNDFVVFILSHGRPDNVRTYRALRDQGYSGRIVIIVDDEDETAYKYQENFNDVYIFSKEKIAHTIDTFDNFPHYKGVIYARNDSWRIAKELGYKYFLQLDDDYYRFAYTFKDDFKYATKQLKIKNLDRVFKILLEYYKSQKIDSLCIAQGGDFVGGDNSSVWKKKLKRKVMNSFFCSTDRPLQFKGRINEDVNLYTQQAVTGKIFFTIALLRLEQAITQKNSGGMTELYLENGTYIKSFYSVICCPSSVKISMMGVSDKRIHHKVTYNKTVPCIIREKYKK